MAYASAADLILRYDARRLGDLVSDDGIAVPEVDLGTDTRVSAALDTASGEVEAALMQGNRYSAADLTGLTGNSLAYLKQLVCDLAFLRLYERRTWIGEEGSPDLMHKRCQECLERLRKGENVFNIAAQKDAGNPSMSTPSRATLLNLHLWRDRYKIYPRRVLPGDP